MSKILNATAAIIVLGLAAIGFVLSKIDDTTATMIVLVPLILHFLPRATGRAVRSLARHRRRVP